MQYDLSILFAINGLSGHISWLDHLITYYTKYGPVLFGVYLIGLWFAGKNSEERKENRKQALYAFFSALLALGISQFVGLMWFRNRPYIDQPVHRLVSVTADASFPSDHAAGSFSIAGSILFGQSVSRTILTVLAILLSLSRVYVGVHYPSDILGGMVVGLLSSMVINKNQEFFEKPIALLLSIWDIIEANLTSTRNRNSSNKEVYKG